MNIDKRRELSANLVEQWTDLPFKDKRETVEDAALIGVISTTVLNSARLASKGNWPAAFYNLALGAGLTVVTLAATS